MTSPKQHLEAITRLYDAYGRGDIDAVLAELADDVDWAAEAASTTVPWYGPFRGKSEVPRFFKEIGASLEISEFSILGMTSNDTDVVTTVHWSFTVRATGKSASMYMQHWWRFGPDGTVVFFRGSEDSEQTVAAFKA